MRIQPFICALPSLLRRHALMKLLIKICPAWRFQKIQFNENAASWGDLKDVFFRQYLRTKTFEPEFFAIASPFIPRGGTFFDVGANFGLCSFGLLGLRPNEGLKCHLFEANKNLIPLLERSRSLYPHEAIGIHYGCVSNKEGFSALEFDETLLGSGYVSSERRGEVPHVVLDQIIEEEGIQQIDFMKIDVEGSELFALEGCRRALSAGIVKAIYIEISIGNLTRAKTTPEECLSFLCDSGFNLYWCKPDDLVRDSVYSRKRMIDIYGKELSISPLTEFKGIDQTDILAIHRSLEDRK